MPVSNQKEDNNAMALHSFMRVMISVIILLNNERQTQSTYCPYLHYITSLRKKFLLKFKV